jgi:hypothetical protein
MCFFLNYFHSFHALVQYFIERCYSAQTRLRSIITNQNKYIAFLTAVDGSQDTEAEKDAVRIELLLCLTLSFVRVVSFFHLSLSV